MRLAVVLASVLHAATSHVIPAKKSVDDNGRTIHYVPSVVRTQIDIKTALVINFEQGPEQSCLKQALCADNVAFLPVYMGRRGFLIPCCNNPAAPSSLSFSDFASHVSLTAEGIITGHRLRATQGPLIAAAPCRRLSDCKFPLAKAKEFFRISMQDAAHDIPQGQAVPICYGTLSSICLSHFL